MGTGLEIAAWVAVTLIIGVGMYYLTSSMMGNPDSGYDRLKDVQITEVSEGIPIKLICGECRVTANITYYGNLTSIERTQEAEGGKGGGGSQQVSQGYDYYCDLMQTIGYGKLVYVKHYLQDKDKEIECLGTYSYNDGTQITTPESQWGGVQAHVDVPVAVLNGANLGGAVPPGSLHIRFTGADQILAASFAAYDDGNGNIVGGLAGTIDYETGILAVSTSIPGSLSALVSYGIASVSSDQLAIISDLAKGAQPATAAVAVKLGGTTLGGSAIGGGMIYETYLTGVAWAWMGQFYLGRNVANVPTIHWVVRREYSTGLPNENMTNGSNPAAVIYDMYTNKLYGAGKKATDMNWTSFVAASNWYYAKGYGINYCFDTQNKLEQILEKIFGWVGGNIYIDADNLVCISVFNENDASQKTFDEDDFKEFSIERPAWTSTFNEVKGNYYDKNEDYVTKSIILRDPANIAMQGLINSRTVDLTAFSEPVAITARLWEILRACTYPPLRVEFTTLLETAGKILPGMVVTINHADYGLSGLKIRITESEYNLQDDIEVSYKGEQMIEAMMSLDFEPRQPVGPGYIHYDIIPSHCEYQAVFELPRTSIYKDVQNFIILAARPGMEEGAQAYKSLTLGSGYESLADIHRFSQHGVIDVNYPATTHPIDDEIGIIYTPSRNWMNPVDCTRSQLFSKSRYAICGNEVMKFQYHDPYGSGFQYQLRGIVRGLFGTPIEAHNDGDTIWITETYDQIIEILVATTFYLKLYPYVGDTIIDPSDAAAITVTPTQKALTPWTVTKIEATRTAGNVITATWWPRTMDYYGAGAKTEDSYYDTYPFNFDGDFEIQLNYSSASQFFLSACTYSWTTAGQQTIAVRNRVNGIYSGWVYLTVGATAGRYITEIGAVTY